MATSSSPYASSFRAAAAFLSLSSMINPTSGHGYVNSPRSRNIVAFLDGEDWTPNPQPNTPKRDHDPMSLNRGGICGVGPTQLNSTHYINYAHPPNYSGGLMPKNVQATFLQEQEVEFEVVLTAHHMGHIEYKACPLEKHGDTPTQECFDNHPLTFVQDLSYGLPPDSNYPNRLYVPPPGQMTSFGNPPGKVMRHKFRLPAGLNGDLVLIQWHYVTGNTCFDVGYDDYFGTGGPSPFTVSNLNDCSQPLNMCGDVGNDFLPEQFWNCIEVTITPSTNAPPSPIPAAGPASLGCGAETVGGPAPAPITYPPPTTPSTPAPAPVPTVGTARCGLNFDDANSKCGATCGGSNGLCTPPEGCFADLSVDVCPVPTPSPTKAPTISPTDSPTEPANPTMSPTLPLPTAGPPPPPEDREGDSRMIAYLGNWQSCPGPTEYDKYTHIVIAFAVSYTWSPSKNMCDQSCTIGSPVPICNNQNNQALVDLWRSQGKKVILSFGGAGMGGSWAGDNNDCWEYCFGREASVVSQIDTIVRAQNFDGVDIDYEYFYNDNDPWRTQYGSGPAARNFLDTITKDLKTTLPPGQNLITHAPMDPDVMIGTGYYDILKSNAAILDFLMPQYYNGYTRPAVDGLANTGSGAVAALTHYNTLVNDMFSGDATKVVFGFCIQDCSGTGSNANGAQASAVMTELADHYPCNGGAFFWVAAHDSGGSWSEAVSNAISDTAICGPLEPTISPAPSPVPPPPTTPPPTQPSSCPASSNACGPGNPCTDGSCCSQWGYCGTTAAYCGECCQSNCWSQPTPSPVAPTPTTPMP
eukprot:CAMPEP_0185725884 /NCGR_PEP_ID=MMETSP1171-20130828/2013_1 /TAXON_ID=374046 /ORGANISM="Helicotheca tamensis, Strain CCMP826" /LENGTH=807 /DNA_ID=CAMNT_0028394107 /DNA_START=1 /DNA_END=2420 /DNA_ORIENTATION=+